MKRSPPSRSAAGAASGRASAAGKTATSLVNPYSTTVVTAPAGGIAARGAVRAAAGVSPKGKNPWALAAEASKAKKVMTKVSTSNDIEGARGEVKRKRTEDGDRALGIGSSGSRRGLELQKR